MNYSFSSTAAFLHHNTLRPIEHQFLLKCTAKVTLVLTPWAHRWWLFALVLFFLFSTSAKATDWTIEDLGGRSAENSVAYDINARGQVTGSTNLQNRFHAFFYDGTHALRFIGTLPGMPYSEGDSINAWGQIVGDSGNSEGLWHAMFYDPSRGMFDLDPSGIYSNGYSYAESINIGGLAVGLGTTLNFPPFDISPEGCLINVGGGGGSRAVLWTGGIHDLGTLPSYFLWSDATDINDNGLIVGWSSATPLGPYYHFEPSPHGPGYPDIIVCDSPSFFRHAAFYDGGWHDLGTLGGSNSVANAVNNRGQIVGDSQIGGDEYVHAFLYDGGNMRDIHPSNWPNSLAIDINNNGLVVGMWGSWRGSDNFFAGFFYDGVAHNINAFPEVIDAGWHINGAFAINDSGQIVGYGVNRNGQTHAYRMHPQSTSRYIQTVDVNALYDMGCSQTNQRGIAVLDFGRPIDNSVGGQRDQNTIYGATLFQRNGFTQISEIELAVIAFLRGYYICNGQPGYGVLKVAVGTSNQGTFVTREHGQAWGAMMGRLNDYIVTNGYVDRLSVVGAIDIEQGDQATTNWSTPAQAIAWVDGYASISTVGYINYGSANGCPATGTGSCSNGWSQGDIQYVSWGTLASLGPVPEIYANVPPRRPTNALQWATLATLNSSTPRVIPGALTQWQACSDRGCTNATNTPMQGWQQLMDALYNASPNTAPFVYTILYSSDITWQN